MAHTISRRALSVLASLLLLGGLFASCAKQSPLSFDQMRERYYLTLVPDADLSDTLVQRRINALDDAAGPLWKSLNKAPDRGWLWEENKDTTVSMMMGGNFAKLNTLAAAYRTKGSLLREPGDEGRYPRRLGLGDREPLQPVGRVVR